MRELVQYGVFTIILLTALTTMPIFAEKQNTVTETIPIDDSLAIEKTTLTMDVPSSNKLPWGFVEGKITNAATDYPVIIQIYKDNEAYHFAQTDVNEDGTYEYRFRVLDTNSERTIKIFEGDYIVKIFKVVQLHTNAISA
jgi:hypothetical protein